MKAQKSLPLKTAPLISSPHIEQDTSSNVQACSFNSLQQTSIKNENGWSIELMDINLLRPSERTIPDNLERVKRSIETQKIIHRALCVERDSYVVMDGHHRLKALQLLKCVYAPVVLLHYTQVSVLSWKSGDPFDYQTIISRGLESALLPPKTTRHIFPEIPDCDIPLSRLRD